jgi:hypothetical protein
MRARKKVLMPARVRSLLLPTIERRPDLSYAEQRRGEGGRRRLMFV